MVAQDELLSEEDIEDFKGKRKESEADPFWNPDHSGSEMSGGVSRSPSPEGRQMGGIGGEGKGKGKGKGKEGDGDGGGEKRFRRGVVTPSTDFDALLNFKDERPLPDPAEGKKKRKRREENGEVKEMVREVGMNCHDQVETPEMSWVLRSKRIGGWMSESGNGEGSSTSAGVGGVGGDVKEKKIKKGTARRVGGVPKRAYVWKDEKKNKDSRKGSKREGKGKGKEVQK